MAGLNKPAVKRRAKYVEKAHNFLKKSDFLLDFY